jgi:putative peptide zinc metalloprotease protein
VTETRPTFIESWYRVANLTPRLLAAVNVHRQHFRGVQWYVLQNPANNEYFRLSRGAYHFAAMLDGRRTVGRVWRTCMDAFGDAAPTQGEVVDLLTRLYAANLLQGDVAPDAEALFQRRRKRAWREMTGFLRNFLFIRIPLWDPDRFLERWAPFFGKLFTVNGLLLWAGLMIAGLWAVGGHLGDLARQAPGILNPNNLPLLYAALVIVKVFHEMAHAFSCKQFGMRAGTGGEVHKMGVTLLVFAPLPYVEASSAWALRNKWQRIVVGAAGMLVELAIAAIAGILWVRTAEGTTVHAIAYNVMFVASVSTLLFNGNPFLRYDAYYILLDLLEIPNLDSRSKTYLSFLAKRNLWGVKHAHDPSHTSGERGWLVFYAVTAMGIRAAVTIAIVLFLGSRFFLIGAVVAVFMVATWIFIPLGNLLRYLAVSPELARVRPRATLTSAAAAVVLLGAVGLVHVPERFRIEGVVEPVSYAVIHMKSDGFVDGFLDSGKKTGPNGPGLLSAVSPILETRRDQLHAERRRLQVRRKHAQAREAVAVQIMEEKIAALEEKIARNHQEMADLNLQAPFQGTWVAPNIDRLRGVYLKRGRRVGVVADLDALRIRAVAGQTVAAELIRDAGSAVEIRVKGNPEVVFGGRIATIIPAGQERLPSAALGYSAGGSTQTALDDPEGRQASEPFFEILVVPDIPEGRRLMPGQSTVLRFDAAAKPLLVQAWKALLQLFQRRFKV